MKKKISAFILASAISLGAASGVYANDMSGNYNTGGMSGTGGTGTSFPAGINDTNPINYNNTGTVGGQTDMGGQQRQTGTAGQQTQQSQFGQVGQVGQGSQGIQGSQVGQMGQGGQTGKLSVTPEAYIVQEGDELWLFMGNIKAKLSVLIYTDPRTQTDKNSLVIPIINNGIGQ